MKRTRTKRNAFINWLQSQAEALSESGSFGTARNYRRALQSYRTFASEAPGRLPSWPDEKTIIQYDNWLKNRGVIRNTSSFYMRILRAAYNKAVKNKLVLQHYPFTSVYTGIDRTKKRAIDENTILRMQNLPLKKGTSMSLARDLFIFSYCTRGMAFVDMAFLKKKNIRKGCLEYSRRKTGQRLSVRIEPCMEEIMKRYTREDSQFVFPIIRSDDSRSAYREYQSSLSLYNKILKKLGSKLGLSTPLSSYIPRHSWATTARKYNIPISIISQGMGHTSEHTTEIYLASLDNSAIDRANSQILSALNSTVSPKETVK